VRVLTRRGANVRNRTYVPLLVSIAGVILRSVAQRLRLQADVGAVVPQGMVVIRTHGKCAP